ncbi:sulfatase-like hydrolase/transferase [Chloroflexi bacterium TSY]|uniref:sulfatase-like hydrolase/transferase n=1 Tax=Candidatus Entotheonella palauensis TaxID=93172 RepID=UPI000B7F639B|nr:sulfatase-like hydrolase/transferase [Candidatus Entotheonella palauensis]MBV7334545.1 sulfatase-like hydrolase/transferase [Chloroflexi bacterium TSY]
MSQRPNILIIVVDQLRADVCGCYGGWPSATPNLDRLAAGGTVFTQAYCPYPQCSPTRASLMTGLEPLRTGIGIQSNYRMLGERTVEQLDPALPALGPLFREAGYRTGYIGKWHLDAEEPTDNLSDRGFDYYFRSNPHVADVIPTANPCGFYRDGIAGVGRSTESWEGMQAHRAAEFIYDSADGNELFLLVYSDPRPHPVYNVTQADLDLFAPDEVALWPNIHDDLSARPIVHRRLRENIMGDWRPTDDEWCTILRHYAALIGATDRDVGTVLDALDESGAADDTIVVYVSDHGDYCGAHGNLTKGVAPYEELLRVPLVFRWPGHFSAGGTCEELVTHMDILPTLAEAAAVDIPDEIDGSTLVPLLSGEPSEWRDHVVITHHGNAYGLCTMRAVITDDYKYVYWPYDTAELYDRQADKWEMENRIDDPDLRGVAERLHGMLLAHRQRTGDRFYLASAPPRET